MSQDRSLYRTGMICAVLTAISWAVFVYGMIASPRDPITTLAELEAYGTSPGVRAYLWGGVFGSFLVIPVFLAIHHGYRRQIGPLLQVPVTLGIVGAALLALGFMVDSGSSAYQYLIDFEGVEQADVALLLQAASLAQNSIEMTWAVASILAYGLAILWIALLLRGTNDMPGWLSWCGIIGGAAGFIWALRWIPLPVPQSLAIPVLMLNILLVVVWLLGVSRQRLAETSGAVE